MFGLLLFLPLRFYCFSFPPSRAGAGVGKSEANFLLLPSSSSLQPCYCFLNIAGRCWGKFPSHLNFKEISGPSGMWEYTGILVPQTQLLCVGVIFSNEHCTNMASSSSSSSSSECALLLSHIITFLMLPHCSTETSWWRTINVSARQRHLLTGRGPV